MTMRNPYKHSAQLVRAQRLVEELDTEALDRGVNPFRHAAVILENVRARDDLFWRELSTLAAIRPPSSETLGLVFDLLERRIERGRLAS